MTKERKISFTDRKVASLPAHDADSPSKDAEYSDTQVTGLKVFVGKTGKKRFAFRYTCRGRKRAARIGEFPAIGVAEARATALTMRAIVDRGGDPQDEKDRQKAMPTFGEFANDEYMPYARQNKKSADDDDSKLRHHLLPKFGDWRLCDITTRDIQMYVGAICVSHTPATANRHYALLSRMFRLGQQWDRITKNPCVGIKRFREEGRKERYLAPADLVRLFAAMTDEPNKVACAAIKLLVLTGMRREECLRCRWDDVDLTNGLIYLPETKAGRPRYVVLNDDAQALLTGLPRLSGCPWVFPGKDPKLPTNNIRKTFGRLLAKCELPHARIHDLRHTFASLAAQSGVSLFQVSQLLGHSTVAMTQRYAHLCPDSLRAASQSVVAAVAKATAKQ